MIDDSEVVIFTSCALPQVVFDLRRCSSCTQLAVAAAAAAGSTRVAAAAAVMAMATTPQVPLQCIDCNADMVPKIALECSAIIACNLPAGSGGWEALLLAAGRNAESLPAALAAALKECKVSRGVHHVRLRARAHTNASTT